MTCEKYSLTVSSKDRAAYGNLVRAESANSPSVDFGGDNTITLNPGSPSITSLVSHLQTQLQTIDAGFSASFDTYTNRITISHSTTNFELKWVSSTDYTAEWLGFDGSANDTGASSYTGDYLPNLSIKAIQLHSSTLRQFMYYNDNTSHDNDLIMTIPVVNADHGGFIYHEPIYQNVLSQYLQAGYLLHRRALECAGPAESGCNITIRVLRSPVIEQCSLVGQQNISQYSI
mmetsp:Transcript_6551/g.24584  ORF Transcript_6551/g.24584 Transcript_6551/m.24584 type:complete len:231 (-) Transcript_6551:252-944(-)